MSYKFKRLLKKLNKLNLPDGNYAVLGSGPMTVRGLRDAEDLDVVVKDELYEKLRQEYKEVEFGHIKIGDDIEIFSSSNILISNPDEVINRAETFKGFKFIRLEDLIKWKEKMGRKKDFEDIESIKEYLDKKTFKEVQNEEAN
jgi:predicted nucleotidyltransferase